MLRRQLLAIHILSSSMWKLTKQHAILLMRDRTTNNTKPYIDVLIRLGEFHATASAGNVSQALEQTNEGPATHTNLVKHYFGPIHVPKFVDIPFLWFEDLSRLGYYTFLQVRPTNLGINVTSLHSSATYIALHIPYYLFFLGK